MKPAKSPSRKWRLNYTVMYMNSKEAIAKREFVHNILISAATLRKIDYAIDVDTPTPDELRNSPSKPLRELVVDRVYFRSSPKSLSSIGEFRSLIDGLFRGFGILLCGDSFEVFSQPQRVLSSYPFPKEFCRPLEYPYVEYHNGTEVKICIPEAILPNIPYDD